MTSQEYALLQVETELQWQAYHAIRSEVLFIGEYDSNNADDRDPNNRPVLLYASGQAVGAMRVDLVLEETYAIMRTVAVPRAHQRQGYGKTMLAQAEYLALHYGCEFVVTNADKDALQFYLACGYEPYDWDSSLQDENGVQMRKLLTAS